MADNVSEDAGKGWGRLKYDDALLTLCFLPFYRDLSDNPLASIELSTVRFQTSTLCVAAAVYASVATVQGLRDSQCRSHPLDGTRMYRFLENVALDEIPALATNWTITSTLYGED